MKDHAQLMELWDVRDARYRATRFGLTDAGRIAAADGRRREALQLIKVADQEKALARVASFENGEF